MTLFSEEVDYDNLLQEGKFEQLHTLEDRDPDERPSECAISESIKTEKDDCKHTANGF